MQTPMQYYKLLISSDSINTDYDWITAGAINTQLLIKNPIIVNRTSTSLIVTIKVKKYNGSYIDILTIDYTIASLESEGIFELSDQVLIGGNFPDKVTVSFNTVLDESLNCLASAVNFS